METKYEQFKSEDVLAEIKRSLHARDVVDVEEDQVKIVVFRAGGQCYAFYGRDVREILSGREIYPVPFLPEHLPGLINVRGDIEAAIDICRFLGGQRAGTGKELIAMVQHGSFRSGVIVDSIDDVLDVPLSSIMPPLPTLTGILRDLVAGSVEFAGQPVALIDIEKLAARVAR